MNSPTHEIYFKADDDVVGTAYYLPDGDISITLNNGSFAGIFRKFENWNPGGYDIRAINNENLLANVDFEFELQEKDQDWLDSLDQKNMINNPPDSWGEDNDYDFDLDSSFDLSNNIEDTCNFKVIKMVNLFNYTAFGPTQYIFPKDPKIGDEIEILVKTNEKIIIDESEENHNPFIFLGYENTYISFKYIENLGWRASTFKAGE